MNHSHHYISSALLRLSFFWSPFHDHSMPICTPLFISYGLTCNDVSWPAMSSFSKCTYQTVIVISFNKHANILSIKGEQLRSRVDWKSSVDSLTHVSVEAPLEVWWRTRVSQDLPVKGWIFKASYPQISYEGQWQSLKVKFESKGKGKDETGHESTDFDPDACLALFGRTAKITSHSSFAGCAHIWCLQLNKDLRIV